MCIISKNQIYNNTVKCLNKCEEQYIVYVKSLKRGSLGPAGVGHLWLPFQALLSWDLGLAPSSINKHRMEAGPTESVFRHRSEKIGMVPLCAAKLSGEPRGCLAELSWKYLLEHV